LLGSPWSLGGIKDLILPGFYRRSRDAGRYGDSDLSIDVSRSAVVMRMGRNPAVLLCSQGEIAEGLTLAAVVERMDRFFKNDGAQ